MTAPTPSGVYPMLYAFFGADGALDRDAMRRQVRGVLKTGVHGIAVGGLASESNKLSTAERRKLVQWVAAELDRRLPLSVTIAESSIATQVEMAEFAADHGAAWLVLQPPPVRDASEEELLRFYGAVADRVTLPVGIQNAPDYIGIAVSNAGFAELNRRHPSISILKAEGPATYIAELAAATDRAYTIFNGRNGIELVDSLRAGCAGMIPGLEACDVQARIFDMMQAGDEAGADQAFKDILPLLSFLMHSIDHLLCYGKRLAARRLGIEAVHERAPAQRPSDFGLDLVTRWSVDLAPF